MYLCKRNSGGTLQRVNSITVRADFKSVKSMTDGYYSSNWGNDHVSFILCARKNCIHNELYRKPWEVNNLRIINVIDTRLHQIMLLPGSVTLLNEEGAVAAPAVSETSGRDVKYLPSVRVTWVGWIIYQMCHRSELFSFQKSIRESWRFSHSVKNKAKMQLKFSSGELQSMMQSLYLRWEHLIV